MSRDKGNDDEIIMYGPPGVGREYRIIRVYVRARVRVSMYMRVGIKYCINATETRKNIDYISVSLERRAWVRVDRLGRRR